MMMGRPAPKIRTSGLMLQLIYMSTATFPASDQSVRDLCDEAARNNERDEVTGILMLAAGHFIQALEGPKVAVEDAFLRIVLDRRHTEVLVLSRRLITRREYGEWAMVACTDGDKPAALNMVGHVLERAPNRLRDEFQRRFAGCFASSNEAVQHGVAPVTLR